MTKIGSTHTCGDGLTTHTTARATGYTRLLLAMHQLADHGWWEMDLQTLQAALWPESLTAPSTLPRPIVPTITEIEEMLLELAEAGWLELLPSTSTRSATEVLLTDISLPLMLPTSTNSTPSPTLPPPTATLSSGWDGDPGAPSPHSAPGAPATTTLPTPPRSTTHPQNHAANPAVNKSIVGREREVERTSERETPAPHPTNTAPSSPPHPSPALDPNLLQGLRMPPSKFCRAHEYSPPDNFECPNCGTARGRAEQYMALKKQRREVLTWPPGRPRDVMLGDIDTQMHNLEAAAAVARSPQLIQTALPGLGHAAGAETPSLGISGTELAPVAAEQWLTEAEQEESF